MPGKLPDQVLVVDDDPDVVDSYRRLLTRRLAGVKVLTAGSPRDALSLLNSEKFLLVMADFRMPEMDGIAFLAEVRRRQPDARLVLFTAYADAELARRASDEAKTDFFIAKDSDPEQVVAKLKRLLR